MITFGTKVCLFPRAGRAVGIAPLEKNKKGSISIIFLIFFKGAMPEKRDLKAFRNPKTVANRSKSARRSAHCKSLYSAEFGQLGGRWH